MTLHLDTDFLIYALETTGWERRRLFEVAESNYALCISAVAWYEFSRGPRTPEQLATAHAPCAEDGVAFYSTKPNCEFLATSAT